MAKVKKDKIVAIIQARVNSTRLPRKMLLTLPNGKTILENVVDRVGKSRLVDQVIVATTAEQSDDEIVRLCQKRGFEVFRGSEEDVLDRYYQAAKKFAADRIVRITGDCPLIDPRIIDQVIQKHFAEGSDYTANAYKETYPDGLDVEIFTFAILEQAYKKAFLPSQREHPTQYIIRNPDKFKIGNLEYKKNLSDKRWTLDEPQDWLFIQEVFKGINKSDFFMEDVLAFLEKNPHLEKINRRIARNEGLMKSLKKDKLAAMKGKR